MRFLQTSRNAMTMLLVLGLGSLATGAEQDKKTPDKGVMHTIDARVTYSSGTSAGTNVLAERQPGFFKVPAGQVARHFKYYFVDPKLNIERDKLNNHTIYCETTKSWVEIPADPAMLELPSGEYKFVVGGTPGAGGTLNFRTFASSGVAPPPPDGKPQPPTIRRPPPGDTTKSGTPRAPLRSGGEGKRKVTVHVTTTYTQKGVLRTGSADMPASLTVDKQKMILDFGSLKPSADGKTTATMRWEGAIEKQGDSTSVNGTTFSKVTLRTDSRELHTQYQGLFSGKLEGTALRGTYKESGTGAGIDGKVFHVEQEGEWSIKDFVK